ncbi:hypothetical protein TNCV_4383431 [Trichonephila clavipes]|nr:hypothetical protein TNCV_4383431 [Trichonephila clavipes]
MLINDFVQSIPGFQECDEVVETWMAKGSSKGPSNADAFSALETATEWYEQQPECCPTQLLLLKRIRDLGVEWYSAKKSDFPQ